MKRYVLAIVPARGNSKGIPRKNIKPFLGEPLIARTLREAQKTRLIDRLVVSTESTEVARVARRCRAEVVSRSRRLARDDHLFLDMWNWQLVGRESRSQEY